jgi:hypothetical protein
MSATIDRVQDHDAFALPLLLPADAALRGDLDGRRS